MPVAVQICRLGQQATSEMPAVNFRMGKIIEAHLHAMEAHKMGKAGIFHHSQEQHEEDDEGCELTGVVPALQWPCNTDGISSSGQLQGKHADHDKMKTGMRKVQQL